MQPQNKRIFVRNLADSFATEDITLEKVVAPTKKTPRL